MNLYYNKITLALNFHQTVTQNEEKFQQQTLSYLSTIECRRSTYNRQGTGLFSVSKCYRQIYRRQPDHISYIAIIAVQIGWRQYCYFVDEFQYGQIYDENRYIRIVGSLFRISNRFNFWIF